MALFTCYIIQYDHLLERRWGVTENNEELNHEGLLESYLLVTVFCGSLSAAALVIVPSSHNVLLLRLDGGYGRD
jgi:hypothetical protein